MIEVNNTPWCRLHGLMLVLCLLVVVALRLPWVGHLLVWDEAMNLCSVRALLAGGQDDFSNWVWRHPPLFCVLMLLVKPMQGGFAERVELITIGVALLNAGLLFAINRKVFSVRTALWSVFFLGVMPGSIFFDVWIKRDILVVTFGLLAMLLMLHKHLPYAAFCLGLALLTKETAVFYVMACGLLWLWGAGGRPTWKGAAVLVAVPLLTCGWWYGWLSRAQHVEFALSRQTGFNSSWDFYGGRALHDLGWPGVILAVAGAAVLGAGLLRQGRIREDAALSRRAHGWPVWLLVPSLVLLSLLPSKVPWVVVVLFPAWATLQGVGAAHLLNPTRGGAGRRCVMGAAALLLAGVLVWQVAGRDYEATLKRAAEGQWRGAGYSREIAETMNRLVKDDERIVMTSFHYWTQLMPGHACAVFAYYFTRDAAVLLRSHERGFEELREDVEAYELDWALLSPEPGDKEREVFGGFIDQLGLVPVKMEKAYLFRTSALYGKGP